MADSFAEEDRSEGEQGLRYGGRKCRKSSLGWYFDAPTSLLVNGHVSFTQL